MKTVELGTTGVQVSELALGAMQLGTLVDDESSFALLDRYTADGGSFIDTADVYSAWWAQGTSGGQSESLLGRWFAARGNRDRVFLSTKASAWWTDPGRVWPPGAPEPDWDLVPGQWAGASAPVLRRSLEGSLERLGTDYVDLYYVHVDDRSTPLEETLEALAGFVADGKIRFYGYSNTRAWRLEAIRQLCDRYGWPTPVALQQEHSYLQRRAGLEHASIVDDEQLDYLRVHPDLTLVAYSPLLKGIYDKPREERERQYNYAGWYTGEHSTKRLAALESVAEELGALPGQVVLAWMIAQQNPRRIPLIGTGRLDHYVEQAKALELDLSPEHLAALDQA